MASDKELAALARLVLTQKLQIEAAAQMLASQARLLSRTMKKCEGENCKRMALVKHVHTDVSLCESCAAKVVVSTGRAFVKSEPDDEFNTVRGTLMREEDWHHLPDAKEIRNVQDYLDALDDFEGRSSSIKTIAGLH